MIPFSWDINIKTRGLVPTGFLLVSHSFNARPYRQLISGLTLKPSKPRIFTAMTLRSSRQVGISCLPLRSLRLRGENAFILLRFFTAETLGNLPACRNHMASLIALA